MSDNETPLRQTDLQDITLEPGVYDFTHDIQDYLVNNTPLSQEVLNVMRTFDHNYDIERDKHQELSVRIY